MMIAYNYTKQCAALLFLVEWGGWRGGRGGRDCTRTVCWKNQSCFMEALCAAAPFSAPVDEHTWIWTAALINMAETGWLPLRWCDVTKVLSTHETGIHDALWWACITKGGIQKPATAPVCFATGLWSGRGIFQCLCWIMLLYLIWWTGSVRLTDWIMCMFLILAALAQMLL